MGLMCGCFGLFANALDAKAKWSGLGSDTYYVPGSILMTFPQKHNEDYGLWELKSFIHCITFFLDDLPCLLMILIAVWEVHFSKLLWTSLAATVVSIGLTARRRTFRYAYSLMKKVDWHQYLCCFFPIRLIHAVLSFILGSSIIQNDEYKGVGVAILVSGILQTVVFCGNCFVQFKAEGREQRGMWYMASSCCLALGNDIHCMVMEFVAIRYDLHTEIALYSVVFSILCLLYSCFSASFHVSFNERESDDDVEMVKRSPDTENPEDLDKNTQNVTGEPDDLNKTAQNVAGGSEDCNTTSSKNLSE